MTSPRAWRPLLAGRIQETALRHSREIMGSLDSISRTDELSPSYGRDVAASLSTGAAGLAVAFAYLHSSGVFPDEHDRASTLLGAAVDAVGDEEMELDLFGGYTGIGWAVSHLRCGPDDSADDDPLAEVDTALLTALEREQWEGPFDLVSGLVGIGVYAIERLPRPAAARALARTVTHLRSLVTEDDGLPCWKTGPELLSPYQRDRYPSGRFDLGVAHGVPGVIGLLAQACAAGVAEETARPLLEGAVRWLLARRQEGSFAFPYWLSPEGRNPPTRSAWCYGDPGIAAVLLLAARCAGEQAWARDAVSIALQAVARPPEDGGVVDASICHGAAGLAHVYNRIFQRTGRTEFREAAAAWFERALGMRVSGAGHGGYLTALRDTEGNHRFATDPSLLSGASGIAMALAAASTPAEPTWDRILLLSSPLE